MSLSIQQRCTVAAGAAACVAVLLLSARPAPAADDFPMCPDPQATIEAHTYLRALSLDLRGTVPTPEEYAQIGTDGSIPEELIDSWLDTPEFAREVVRHHKTLFWPNISDIRLLSNHSRMIRYGDIWYRYLVAPYYRGGPVHCGDFEAQFTADGELITSRDADGYIREGWVWVRPYWAPDTQIKVCAFEAQPDLVSPWGTPCDGYDGRFDPHCGCGPNLAWCDTPELSLEKTPVHRAIAEDLNHRVARVIEEDLSYLELLTGRTAFVNGPLVHFYKYQIRIPAHVRFADTPVDPSILPNLAFTDENTWVPIELGEEQAGVLTSPAFLMKFQSNRARANRFYNAFLCQPFQPPDDGLPGLESGDATLDLTRRDGCKYCHAILEPSASYWGRWTEYGTGYLNPERYPAYNPDCEWCALTGNSCTPECIRYYVTDPLSSEENPYIGWMLSYEFRTQQQFSHIEEGPKVLVQRGVQDGRLPACVATNTARWLLGRDIKPSEAPWIQELARRFASSDFRYKELVKAIVFSESYRRVR